MIKRKLHHDCRKDVVARIVNRHILISSVVQTSHLERPTLNVSPLEHCDCVGFFDCVRDRVQSSLGLSWRRNKFFLGSDAMLPTLPAPSLTKLPRTAISLWKSPWQWYLCGKLDAPACILVGSVGEVWSNFFSSMQTFNLNHIYLRAVQPTQDLYSQRQWNKFWSVEIDHCDFYIITQNLLTWKLFVMIWWSKYLSSTETHETPSFTNWTQLRASIIGVFSTKILKRNIRDPGKDEFLISRCEECSLISGRRQSRFLPAIRDHYVGRLPTQTRRTECRLGVVEQRRVQSAQFVVVQKKGLECRPMYATVSEKRGIVETAAGIPSQEPFSKQVVQ